MNKDAMKMGLIWGALGSAIALLCLTTFQAVEKTEPQQEIARIADKTIDAVRSWTTDPEVEQRIINLPEDGGTFHVMIFVRDKWWEHRQDHALLSWFNSDPRLVSLKDQTHFTVYQPSDQMFRSRWAPKGWERAMPAVLVMAGHPMSGQVVYSKGVRTLPTTAKRLGDEIAYQLATWPCPKPGPKPVPVPIPAPTPIPDIPDVGPPVDVPDEGNDDAVALAIAVVVGLLAMGVGVMVSLYGHGKNALTGKAS